MFEKANVKQLHPSLCIYEAGCEGYACACHRKKVHSVIREEATPTHLSFFNILPEEKDHGTSMNISSHLLLVSSA